MAEDAAAACRQDGLYPVLAGPPGTHDLMLVAPFILNDHPQIAPESYGDFCDATEIDEMLTLRTLTLTDDEKRQARATDPRAAAIIDRTDAPLRRGVARAPARGAARCPRSGDGATHRRAVPGARVRLRARARGTDAQDLLYAGMHRDRRASQRHDVDGRIYPRRSTIDDDPARRAARLVRPLSPLPHRRGQRTH